MNTEYLILFLIIIGVGYTYNIGLKEGICLGAGLMWIGYGVWVNVREIQCPFKLTKDSYLTFF